MRRLLAAVLAIPVLIMIYLSVGLRRSVKTRITLAMIVTGAVGLGAVGLRPPAGITAVPVATPAPILDPSVATLIETGESPAAAITLRFPAPMDRASVAKLLEVEPATEVELAWANGATELVVRPVVSWEPGALHTITIDAGALDATGRPIYNRIRAAFLTRTATHGSVTASEVLGERVAVGTSLLIEFDRAIDEQGLDLVSEPPIEGTVERVAEAGEQILYRFTPSDPLTPNTAYTVSLAEGLRDLDGGLVASDGPFAMHTANVPSVVRFRPRTKTVEVALDAVLSVRFSEAMDQGSTQAAWAVSADGSAVGGTISLAEGDTVLVFQPATDFSHGQTIVMSVGAGATSKAGVAIGTAISGRFTTVPKPAPSTPAPPKTAPASTPGPGTGGGTVGAGSWAAVETYYLGLMNCTRTGGTVSSSGTCSSGDSNSTAALWIDAGISSSVSRRYARLLAVNNLCSHFINGNPGDRLKAGGYTSHIWAENLGCQSGDPYRSVLGSHLYFQSEKSYNGGHYVNLTNAKYDRVGIGVWVASGRVRLVVNFYHPL